MWTYASDWGDYQRAVMAGAGSINIFYNEKLDNCSFSFDVSSYDLEESWMRGGNGTYNIGSIRTGIYESL